MTSTSAIIERARAGESYSERKRFTIARSRAIEKMRRFALADPYFYILELIQAAVANHAEFIEIQIEGDDVTLAYVGGGLARRDLANLFDHLFASKDRLETGHLRELALGINAVLLFRPQRVVVESGDGTLAGTTRLELHGTHDAVDIGTPEHALRGTYVRIENMSKDKLPRLLQRSFLEQRPREFEAIELRCLAAPVPILLNDAALFGFSSQRTPSMLGYVRSLSFDEGDLYGTLALGRPGQPSEFDLLMWGVMVQSWSHSLVPGASVSGIVCFDRLRKTADHSGIVHDDRLDEMWARILPYAHQLVHGNQARGSTMLTQIDGTLVPATEVRPLVQEASRCILVPADTPSRDDLRDVIRQVSHRLGAPVLCGEQGMANSLRAMSAGRLSVVCIDPTNQRDLAFYARPEHPIPTRPWFAPVVELPTLSKRALLAMIIASERGRSVDDAAVMEAARTRAHWLGTGDFVRASVFSPTTGQASDALTVEMVTTDRLLWSTELPAATPGLVLRVELPDAAPSTLLDKKIRGVDEAFVASIARAMAIHAGPVLRQVFARAIETLAAGEVEPGSPRARFALRAAVRTCVPRLAESASGRPAVVLEQIDARDVDLLGLGVLRTLHGDRISLRELARQMTECAGLVYAALRGADCDLDGLDTRRILSVDEDEERCLVALFGDSAYVRIDAREVLAERDGARVRDVAIGLRAYPNHPLLVEEGGPVSESSAGDLVRELIARFVGRSPPPPSAASEREDWQECRRHAGRILQHYVCEVARRGVETPVPEALVLPLFLDTSGDAFSLAEVLETMQQPSGVPLVYGHAFGGVELGALATAGERSPRSDRPHTILASGWLHQCLARLGPVRVAFDFDLAHLDETPPELPRDWLRRSAVEAAGVQGVVGIPLHPVQHPDIAMFLPEGGRARALTSLAVEFGCVGWVRLDANAEWTEDALGAFERAVREACESTLEAVFVDLARGEELSQRERCETLLLEYAARHLSLIAQGAALPRPVVASDLADRVFTMPLFRTAHGEAMPAWLVIRRFCAEFSADAKRAQTAVLQMLHPRIAPHLRDWIRRYLGEANVVVKPVGVAALESPILDSKRRVEQVQGVIADALRTLGGLDSIEHVWIHRGNFEGLCSLEWTNLFVDPDDPRTRAVLAQPTGPALAWLLLGLFAELNAHTTQVGNARERRFQAAVSRALRAGRLAMRREQVDRSGPREEPGPP